MLETVTPATLFHTQIATLQETFPSVLNGEADAIHTARIATRRVRELLALLDLPPRWSTLDELHARFKRIGRSLGRVRDADVRVALLASLEQRIPHAAPTLVLVRQRRERERLVQMRKLIKRLERLEAIPMVDALVRARPLRFSLLPRPGRSAQWQRELRWTVAQRAQAAREAIAHATGVYFPHRTHAARIAIKQLRYATEIVHQTGLADRSYAIRALKKAQDLLGDLHDRQVLSDHLAAEAALTSAPDDAGQVALVRQVIDAEARHLHQRYAERRERLVALCCDGVTVVPPRGRLPSLLALTAVVLSSGVWAARRSHAGTLRAV